MVATEGNAVIEFTADVVTWLGENWDGKTGYLFRGWKTLQLAGSAVIAAAVIAIPLGAYFGHVRRGGLAASWIVNIGRALPSFGILALALPFTIRLARNTSLISSGLGFWPAFVALFALALPPIFTNTYTAVREVDPGTVEAARGMGVTEPRILTTIELPLAAPVIIAGLRISAVQAVATAPLAALVAYNGLGRYIIDGFAIRDNVTIFAGALLVALLAIITELAFGRLERRVVPEGMQRGGERVTRPVEVTAT